MKNDDLNILWKALSDPTRRHILDLLRETPRNTGELAEIFAGEMSRYAVMKHLTVLEEANLITIKRKGRERYNYINFVPLQEMYERWLRPYEAEWSTSLINLKRQSEGASMSTPVQNQAVQVQEIEQEISINASVEQTFASLLDFNGWWSHRYARIPDSLRFEAKVGGRFWETRDGTEENGILWGTVTSIEPGDHISLQGNIGMAGAVLGTVTICTLPQDDGTTRVTISHQFMGNVPDGYAEGFGQGWQHNLKALKKLIESHERVKPLE